MTGCMIVGANLWMEENECAFVVNFLTIARVMELLDNLANYKFVTKASVNAK